MQQLLRYLLVFAAAGYMLGDTETLTLTPANVEAFLDGLVPLQLQREDVAGAVIAIVKDDQVLFAKGYGYADVASKKPVTPEGTLFRPGSISKLFTWTSVMQQVEQGKLDLDRDVNDYIDFKIPPYQGKPITLRNIMTHTAGFEEAIKELFVPNAQLLTPLSEYLPTHLPQRVYPPGVTPAYSNYATSVAGYIVQRVSGVPFIEYTDRFIFQPLQMTHSTFAQPLPANLQPLMSTGYAKASLPAKSYEFVEAFPAGSTAVSAIDMTHFMMAHLRDGEYQGARILKPETARLMHTRQFAVNPALNGMALGFYEETRNGHRIIGHGGDTSYFHSDLHLMADTGLGFFISYNSAGKGEIDARGAVWHAFLDRFFPYTVPNTPALATAKQDFAAVAGSYTNSRRPETNLLSIVGLLSTFNLASDKDGNLTIPAFRSLNGQPKKWREISPNVWREADGQDLVTFQKDATGRMTVGLEYPFMVLQKTDLLRNGTFNKAIGIGSLAILVLILVLWPVAALVRWHYGYRRELDPGRRRLLIATRVFAIFNLAAVGVLLYLASKLGDPGAYNSSLDLSMRFMQFCLLLGIAGALIALLSAARALSAKDWWFAKCEEAILAAACIAFSWFAIHWHLLHASLMF